MKALIRYEGGIRKGQEFYQEVVSFTERRYLVTKDDLREHRWLMPTGVSREHMHLRVVRIETDAPVVTEDAS